MSDWERVIANLTRCQDCLCNECDLEHASHYVLDCAVKDSLINDALELLKAQEPRVLRLSEINKLDTVYYEIKKFRDIKPAIVLRTNAVAHHRFLTHDELYDFGVYIPGDIKYEKTWRCWNVMPTTEQRMEANWDEPQ